MIIFIYRLFSYVFSCFILSKNEIFYCFLSFLFVETEKTCRFLKSRFLAIRQKVWYNENQWKKTQIWGVHLLKKRFCFGDAVIYCCIVILFFLSCLCIRLFFTAKEAPVWVSVQTSSETVRYPLTENNAFRIESNGYTLRIIIDGGSVFVEQTDCPNHLCQAQGKISKTGQSIVCLPAGLIITLEGGEHDADIIVG